MDVPKTNRFYRDAEEATPEQEVQRMTDAQLVQVAKRDSYREAATAELQRRGATPSQTQPSETPVSSDATYLARCIQEAAQQASGRLIKHLWIIFVLLPIALALVWVVLRNS